uniref:DUF4371 domain-containing protein n=1 Tax=Oryzias latipes TaxID=8090 RepID=A0A3P9MCI1_ORYLA
MIFVMITLKNVPLSNDTVCRRIDIMGTDIEQVVGKLGDSFSLQLDESTDVSGHAQLVAFVKYIDCEHILFCKEEMEGRTTGEDIFNVVNMFFTRNAISWKSCSSVCTDAAASMTGKNPDIKWTHCGWPWPPLATPWWRHWLHDVLNDSIKVLNFIKSRPLNARFFAIWQIMLRKLNELNMSLQGKDTSILNLYDKVGGFLKKAEMWKRARDQEDFTCFPQLDAFLSNEDVATAPVELVTVGHLANLLSGFHSYFTDMDEKSVQLDWVRNPFLLSEMKFGASTLTQFWLCVRQEHPELGQKALEQLLPFALGLGITGYLTIRYDLIRFLTKKL